MALKWASYGGKARPNRVDMHGAARSKVGNCHGCQSCAVGAGGKIMPRHCPSGDSCLATAFAECDAAFRLSDFNISAFALCHAAGPHLFVTSPPRQRLIRHAESSSGI